MSILNKQINFPQKPPFIANKEMLQGKASIRRILGFFYVILSPLNLFLLILLIPGAPESALDKPFKIIGNLLIASFVTSLAIGILLLFSPRRFYIFEKIPLGLYVLMCIFFVLLFTGLIF